MKNIKLYRDFRRFVFLFGGLNIILFIILFTFFSLRKDNIETVINEKETHEVSVLSTSFSDTLASVNSDIITIRELLEVHDLLQFENGVTSFADESSKEILEDELLVWIKSKNIYDQVRFLDNQGQELARVNYNNGAPFIVPEDQLQNKAGRYYFTDTIGLDTNQIYLSKLDLNVENGEIELVDGIPKQMIRFVVSVQDENKNPYGVIILNYFADNLLHIADDIHEDTYTEISVLNDDGYFLHASDINIEFGFMYPDKEDEVFSKYYDYDLLNKNNTTLLQETSKNITYTSLRITNESLSSSSSAFIGEDINVVLPFGDYIIVTKFMLNDAPEYKQLVNLFIIIASITIVLVFVISRLVDELLHNRKLHLLMVEHSANYDLLTNIPNRSYLMKNIDYKISRGKHFSLLFLDFDGFKTINDTYGHAVGDLALKEGVNRMRNAVRQDDFVSRVGGDEFVILLNEMVQKDVIERISSGIIKEFAKPFILDGNECSLGVSIGICIYNETTTTSDQILGNADSAMYLSKSKGKNRFTFFQ